MGTRGLAAAALGAALMVSACADDDPSTGSVDDVSTQAETSEADPEDHEADHPPADTNNATTAEDMPRDQLEAEIDEFIGEFFRVSDEAMHSGDTSTARQMTSPDCIPCWAPLDAFDDIYSGGNRIVGGEYENDYVIKVEHVLGDIARTIVSGRYDALQVVDDSGNEVDSFDAQEFSYMLVVVRSDDGTYFIREGSDYS